MENAEKALLSTLWNYREKQLFCDTKVFPLDGGSLPAHACILAALSPVLCYSLLQETERPYSITVPATTSILESLLKFMYTQKWNFGSDNEDEVRDLAGKLGVVHPPPQPEVVWIVDNTGALSEVEVSVDGGVQRVPASADLNRCTIQTNQFQGGNGTVTIQDEKLSSTPVVRLQQLGSTSGVAINEERAKPPLNSRGKTRFVRPKNTSPRSCAETVKSNHQQGPKKVKDCGNGETSSEPSGVKRTIHSSSLKKTCHTCGKTLTASYFPRHKCKDDSSPRAPKKPCHVCGKLVSEDYLRTHKRIHEGILFKCRVCPRTYKWKRSLLGHEREHSKEDDLDT